MMDFAGPEFQGPAPISSDHRTLTTPRCHKMRPMCDFQLQYLRLIRLMTLFLFLLTLTCVWPAHAQRLEIGRPSEVGMSSSRLAVLDQVIVESIAEEETPGAVLLVARRGKIVYRKAFGLRAVEPTQEEMTHGSIFDVASLTKVMATAGSVMALVEDGKLVLTRPVGDYIPEFSRRGKERVRVVDLLTHFSGLRPDLDLDVPWVGYDRAIELACRERLLDDPGAAFVYSDINYFLLGDIVQRVSGVGLDEFATQRIFRPLGMHDTSFRPDRAKLSRIVPTERRDGVMLRGEVHDPTAARMGGVAGHAGVFSTADDTAAWAQMLLNSGVYNDTQVLSPLSVRKMVTSQAPGGSFDLRGFGFDIDTRFSRNRGDLFPVGSFGHTGFTGTSVWIDPETETLVVLFTSRVHPRGRGNVVGLRSRVASVVAAAILDVDAFGKGVAGGR